MATSNVGSEGTYEQGFDKKNFPISHPNASFASLMVTSAHSADSSFYFCGGSDTVLGGSQRPRQEGLQQPALPAPTDPRSPGMVLRHHQVDCPEGALTII